ncbi:hypothetical protein SAMN02910453_1677 [Lachnospiraceae bacterium A10]|jgi:hypothetical protein|nr:hypothetical protein SAMN02910453_1677 [Lachnospiraceae bacterium A10]
MRNKIRIGGYVLIIAILIAAVASISNHSMQREKQTLQDAIEQDISAYYAREGYYPSSIQELQDIYGLTYDEDRFFIGYQLMGSNIRPYVTIVELEE